MLIVKTSTELQVRDAAIGTDFEEGPHERGKKTQDACLHRVGKTLKTNTHIDDNTEDNKKNRNDNKNKHNRGNTKVKHMMQNKHIRINMGMLMIRRRQLIAIQRTT